MLIFLLFCHWQNRNVTLWKFRQICIGVGWFRCRCTFHSKIYFFPKIKHCLFCKGNLQCVELTFSGVACDKKKMSIKLPVPVIQLLQIKLKGLYTSWRKIIIKLHLTKTAGKERKKQVSEIPQSISHMISEVNKCVLCGIIKANQFFCNTGPTSP